MQTFKDLDVWKKSVLFASDIYRITKQFPKEELYGLSSQMQRASVSISSNIAEGSKRAKNEFIHFIRISQGSAAELETQLFIAHNLGYVSKVTLSEYVQKIEDINKNALKAL